MREWPSSKWNENNSQCRNQFGLSRKSIESEACGNAASGEESMCTSGGLAGVRERAYLSFMRFFRCDCAGPPESTAGLVPFIEGNSERADGTGRTDDAIDISQTRLEKAQAAAGPEYRLAASRSSQSIRVCLALSLCCLEGSPPSLGFELVTHAALTREAYLQSRLNPGTQLDSATAELVDTTWDWTVRVDDPGDWSTSTWTR